MVPLGARRHDVNGVRLLIVLAAALCAAPAARSAASPTWEDGASWLFAESAQSTSRDLAGLLAEDPAMGDALARRTALWQRDFLSPLDDRARLLFLRGEPRLRRVTKCPEIFRDVEVWEYAGAARSERYVLFRADAASALRVWSVAEGAPALYTREAARWLEDFRDPSGRGASAGGGGGRVPGRRLDVQVCKDASFVLETLRWPGAGEGEVKARLEAITPPEDQAARGAWARAVAAETKVVAPAPSIGALGVGLETVPLGLRGLVHVELKVPDRSLLTTVERRAEGVADAEVKRFYAVNVELAIEQRGKLLEIQRARFELPVRDGDDPKAPLALSLEPQLRAGSGYLLRFRVRDEQGGGESRASAPLDVPFTDPTVAASAVPADAASVALSSNPMQRPAVPLPGVDSLALVPPDRDVLLGVWRAEAIVTGAKIRRVVFSLDETPQLTRSGPPWTAELRLPSVPREVAVKAEGLDAANQVVASDTVVLNQVRGSLEVRIVEPNAKTAFGREFTARAEVVVPDGRRVEKVEFRLGDRLLATRTRAPWSAKLATPADLSEPTAFVVATAILDDGSRAEDVQFLRGPANAETVDVDFVELYTTVVDAEGRPVTDLPEANFQVFEDGRRQKLQRFAPVDDLPLTLGVVIDTSGSMLDSLGEARLAAGGFLRALIGPGDRAFAVRFAGRPELVAARTPDGDAVARALEGLSAEGSTALHDAVVHALYYFRGTRGQRALVLLSDGDDTSSLIPYEQAIDIAKRSGVAIYSIGLKLSRADIEARRKLTAMARETGGQVFFVGSAVELEGVYAAIEKELRSQYLLGYVSDAKGAEGFRGVEVKLTGANGLKARTARGYYR
jgi:Ca-activated chloride channel family protein